MKLIVGLGNPEPKYNHTRHNIGFLLLDRIAAQLGCSWQEKPKFKGYIAETHIGNERAILLKPTTYYNLSGEAVRAVLDFYKLSGSSEVLVIHDELALSFGMLRTRLRGSDAGNNGIKNIISHIGQDFARIRVGIAHESPSSQDAMDFVLGTLMPEELSALEHIAQHVHVYIEDFVHQDKAFTPTTLKTQKDQPD